MTTRASKLKPVAEKTDGGATCIIKQGRSEKEIVNALLADVIPRAYGLYRDMKSVEPELKELKTAIMEVVEPMLDGSGTITIITSGVSCKVTTGFEFYIDEADVDALKKALGKRFNDLVKVKTIYKPEMKLVDMCCAGDTPEEIRKAVQVKSKSPAFVFGAMED